MRPVGHSALGTLLALCSLIGFSASASAAVQLHRCDLGAARPLRCGHIDVPLLRGEPALGTTRIGFALRPRSDRHQPSLGTIFAVDGGPGYASTAAEYVRSVSAALAPLLRRRDLVFFDERGTGSSGAIDCPPLQRATIQEYIAIGRCAEQLGPSYAAFTSAEAAADMDAVRAALGRGRIVLYGDSYGTLLGQAYAVRYAAHLRALVLDSAYPADDPYYRTLYPAGMRALNTACRRSPGCEGDASRRFRRVVERFHAAGRSTDPLLRFLLEAGTLAPRSYISLDAGDRLYLRGDPRRLDRLLAPGPLGYGNPRDFSYGLEIAVECNDYPLLWDPALPMAGRIAQLGGSVRALSRKQFSPFSRSEYLFSAAAHLTNCLEWPAPPPGGLEPPVPPGWRAPGTLPTLILAGELDDVTSVREARQVKARFPGSRLRVLLNRGHVSSLYFPYRSPAVGVIRRFVRLH